MLFGCAPTQWSPETVLEPQRVPSLSDNGSREELTHSIDRSLAYLAKVPAEQSYTFGPRKVTRDEMIETLEYFKGGLAQLGLSPEFYKFVSEHFDFFGVRDGDPLFTGYYEASLNGSRKKRGHYVHPVYKVPSDLLRINLTKFPQWKGEGQSALRARGMIEDGTVVPYHDRHAIEFKRVLDGKNLELAWTDDPIKLFFMHIQGSGIMTLEDGKEIHLNFGDTNGQLYRSIGSYLVAQDKLRKEDVSMQSIVAYLRAHPEEFDTITSYNPSFVFFREVGEGPIGSLGQKITPFRSIATDLSLYPRGALAFVNVTLPFDSATEQGEVMSGFVLNQDSGGAIKGPLRVDLFTGRGESREALAGKLKQEGQLFFLLRKREQ